MRGIETALMIIWASTISATLTYVITKQVESPAEESEQTVLYIFNSLIIIILMIGGLYYVI